MTPAGRVVLDATVAIAYLDPRDAHHDAAVSLLLRHVADELVMSALTHAEVLVGPARHGRLDRAVRILDRLQVRVRPLPADAGVALAQLRAATGLKLPDCCVLLAAQQEAAAVGTFDVRLQATAVDHGLSLA